MDCTLGCFNRPYREFPVDVAFRSIAEVGFDRVGFMAHVGEADDPDAVVSPRTRTDLLAADSTDAEIAALRDALDAHGLVPEVVLGPSSREMVDRAAAAGVDHLLTTDGWHEDLPAVAAHAAEVGVTIEIKPHGEPYATGRDCLELVERVDSPAFKIGYDPGNVHNYVDGDPTAEIEEVAPHVTSLCVKDYDPEDGVAVTPGDGEVDFGTVFGALGEAGFQGPALIETLGRGDARLHDDDGGSVAEVSREAERARDYLRGVLDSV
jgi:sugar phosphate isomerase/epimerase